MFKALLSSTLLLTLTACAHSFPPQNQPESAPTQQILDSEYKAIVEPLTNEELRDLEQLLTPDENPTSIKPPSITTNHIFEPPPAFVLNASCPTPTTPEENPLNTFNPWFNQHQQYFNTPTEALLLLVTRCTEAQDYDTAAHYWYALSLRLRPLAVLEQIGLEQDPSKTTLSVVPLADWATRLQDSLGQTINYSVGQNSQRWLTILDRAKQHHLETPFFEALLFQSYYDLSEAQLVDSLQFFYQSFDKMRADIKNDL